MKFKVTKGLLFLIKGTDCAIFTVPSCEELSTRHDIELLYLLYTTETQV